MIIVSRQDRLNIPEADNERRELPADDDQLQIGLRLGLEEVAAAEEVRFREAPRKRPTQSQLTSMAHNMYQSRRKRRNLFNVDLLGEPGWDMLLALYCLPPRGEVLTVSSLSHAAGVPEATGIRWQRKLLDEGLIKRGPHVRDGRVQLIALSQRGRLLMDRYLVRLFYCRGGVPDFCR
jgi:DNA-binding MarR family transcriptional regulator